MVLNAPCHVNSPSPGHWSKERSILLRLSFTDRRATSETPDGLSDSRQKGLNVQSTPSRRINPRDRSSVLSDTVRDDISFDVVLTFGYPCDPIP